MAGESGAGACAAQRKERVEARAIRVSKAGNDEERNLAKGLGVGFISPKG
jgi:hypothetical protein